MPCASAQFTTFQILLVSAYPISQQSSFFPIIHFRSSKYWSLFVAIAWWMYDVCDDVCAPPPQPNSTCKKFQFHLQSSCRDDGHAQWFAVKFAIWFEINWNYGEIMVATQRQFLCARASINLAKRTSNMPINISADMSVERTVRDLNAHRAMQKLPIIISNEIHFDSCRDTYCISVQFITLWVWF